MAPFVDPDWAERGSLIGSVEEGGTERVIALGSWVRLRDPQRAEIAFAVADDYQGLGVGTRLLEQLAELAAQAGIERFVAEVLADNSRMLELFMSAGFDVTRELAGGEIELNFPIASTARFEARIDERDHQAVVASLESFFQPESVAVLGASARPGSIGGTVLRNIVQGGFEGTLYAVNRSGESVAGVPGYASVEDLPQPVDLAIVCLPAEFVRDAAEGALSSGTRALCVISAGFAEVGPEGAAREEALLAAVRSHGARLIGPNCLGLSLATPPLNATFAPRAFPPGPIGFGSQSGALGLVLLERAHERGLGFSAFVSMGNKADVSSNDLLEYWEEDPDTLLVLLYLESFGNPRKFARLARRVSGRKPVLAMKSGVSRRGVPEREGGGRASLLGRRSRHRLHRPDARAGPRPGRRSLRRRRDGRLGAHAAARRRAGAARPAGPGQPRPHLKPRGRHVRRRLVRPGGPRAPPGPLTAGPRG